MKIAILAVVLTAAAASVESCDPDRFNRAIDRIQILSRASCSLVPTAGTIQAIIAKNKDKALDYQQKAAEICAALEAGHRVIDGVQIELQDAP